MKPFFLIVFLIFLLSPLVFAVEFDLNPSYKQGETIIEKISGNFPTPLTKDNVFFYKEHVRIPMDYGLEKIQNEYYLYISLVGKAEGNYTLALEDIQYIQGTETLSEDIEKNFSITNETADFSVKPGAIVSSREFSIEIQNLKDKQITLTVRTAVVNTSERSISIVSQDISSDSLSLSLVSGQTKKIYFTSGYGSPTFQKIEFKTDSLTYGVPVYIFQASYPAAETSYKMEPSELISSIPTNTITKKTIFIYNTGTEEIKNISLSLSDSIDPFVTLSQDYIASIEPKTNFPIELSLFSPGETEVTGSLKANINGQEILYSQISLKFLSNYVPVNETQTSSVKTCAELNGRVCSQTQTCDAEIVYAKDDVCCLGNCVAKKGKSSIGIIIAIAILFVLAVAGFWFYRKKFKKAKKPVNLLDIAKGKD